jgi:hypothetical protein
MALARANGQNKATMSGKEITRKTRELLAFAIFSYLLFMPLIVSKGHF